MIPRLLTWSVIIAKNSDNLICVLENNSMTNKLEPEAGVEVLLVGHHVELVQVLHRPLPSLAIFLPGLSNLGLCSLGSLQKIRLEWMDGQGILMGKQTNRFTFCLSSSSTLGSILIP